MTSSSSLLLWKITGILCILPRWFWWVGPPLVAGGGLDPDTGVLKHVRLVAVLLVGRLRDCRSGEERFTGN